MKKYEKTILKIENVIHPKIVRLRNSTVTLTETKINIAKNLYDVIEWPFNKKRPYRGDYYPEYETED